MIPFDDLIAAIRTVPAVQAAWVFGSVAAGAAHAGSDVDVAVLAEQPLTADETRALIEALAQATGRPVDVVDLQASQGSIVKQALIQGRQLFCDDTTLYAERLKRFWFDQADWEPYRQRIQRSLLERWIES